MNNEAIEQATKIRWADWVTWLNGKEAAELPHKEIATMVHERLKDTLENAGWWAQAVTVNYEQHIGRRKPGQRADGTYEVSASKTLNGSMDDIIERWVKLAENTNDFNGLKVVNSSNSSTLKWRKWRASLDDGTKLLVSVYEKAPGKSVLGLAHNKLKDEDEVEAWREYWKTFLENI